MAENQRQNNNSRTADECTQKGVFKKLCRALVGKMHQKAKADAQHRAEGGKDGDAPERAEIRLRNVFNGKPDRRNFAKSGNPVSNKRGSQAGDDARIINNADRDDLKRKKRRGQGGAEQGGKNRAHSAECCKVHILFVKFNEPSNLRANAAAKLKRRTFAAGRAAEKVGNYG